MQQSNALGTPTLTYDEFCRLPLTNRIELIKQGRDPKKPSSAATPLLLTHNIGTTTDRTSSQVNRTLEKPKALGEGLINVNIKKMLTPFGIDHIRDQFGLLGLGCDKLLNKLYVTLDINEKDENGRTILYHICYYGIDYLAGFVLQFENIKNISVAGKDMFYWTEKGIGSPDKKNRILKLLKAKFS